MIGKAIKLYTYYKAPKTAYAVYHPKHAARLAKTGWDLKHAWAPRLTAVTALAIALPLGYLIGKATSSDRKLPRDV
jgi:hypothetical protein